MNSDRILEPTPRHLWVVGAVSLVWNAFGAMDYVMTQTANEAYMANFSPEQLEFFHSIPSWALGTWAIAVWGGVLGSILLLLRRRLTVQVFLVSFLALVASTFQNYVLSNGLEIMAGAISLGFTAVIFVISLSLFLYAREMERRKILL